MNRIVNHRQKMDQLEKAIIATGQAIDLEVKHYFAEGTYTRELFIPKGTVLTGKIHRQSTINIIAKGKIRAISDQGTHDIEAPHIFVTGPGVKKAGYALEDTVWINVLPWDGEEDIELIENTFTAPSYEALEEICHS